MPKNAVSCCQRSPMKWPVAPAYHLRRTERKPPAVTDDRVPAHLRWRPAMTVEFGLALENFTPERKVPDMDAITAYSATAEELGFASVWAWDHLFLGARRPFPFLEALTTLSWVAARTSRIMLGTGVLVLPIREPAIVAKTAATPQLASGGGRMLRAPSGCGGRGFGPP